LADDDAFACVVVRRFNCGYGWFRRLAFRILGSDVVYVVGDDGIPRPAG
jgi:hypothetical protein